MIKVIEPGVYSTIQDLGRNGYRSQGVPLSGAMDQHSARLANVLVGNDENAPVLEFTMQGPLLLFQKNTLIAVCGAAFTPMLNGTAYPLHEKVEIMAGTGLSFKPPKNGLRGYLAVKDGFKTQIVMGSASHYKGITKKHQIEKGDDLHISSETDQGFSAQPNTLQPISFSDNKIEVYKGPDFEQLPIDIKQKLMQQLFSILPESNRMAILLDGVGELHAEEIITAAVQPGTVQLTPSGKLIVLMRDAQTTGGYARVLQLSSEAINIVSQKRPNEKIKFELK